MATVYVPKVYDTNIQKNYNLPNVALTINGVETNSSATTFSMNNTGGTFSVIAQKKHYNSYGRNECSIVSEHDCSVCGAPVVGGEGTLCPNCGEPLTTEGKTAKLRVAADSIGKILMTREVSDICMTESDYTDILLGASGTTLPGLANNNKLIINKTYNGQTPTNWISQQGLTSKIETSGNTATGSDKKAFKIKSSFIPKPIPEDYDDYKYIRVISGKTININSSAQTINSIIRTNIPSPYNFVSASSVNWITSVHYFEDLHDPNFSLIKVIADVSENNSFTDARSGVITISDSTYGVSGAITVSQSAKTGYSSYDITFNDSLTSGVIDDIDDNDSVQIYGSDGNTLLFQYSAGQYFGASSLRLPNISTSAITPIGEQPNLIMLFDLTNTIQNGASVTILSSKSEEGEINLNIDQASGTLSFKNLLGTTTNQIHIETETNVSQPK